MLMRVNKDKRAKMNNKRKKKKRKFRGKNCIRSLYFLLSAMIRPLKSSF